ncbi:MAG: carbohydrate porin [Herminiimonas sp.]|nr:carbohydrate porin [Herminiimonas sp.]
MLKHTVLATALGAALGLPAHAWAASDQDLAQIRAQIQQLKSNYEARIQALEKRLQETESRSPAAALAQTTPIPIPIAAAAAAAVPGPVALPGGATPAMNNAFNPSISLILGGTYANLSQNPDRYRIQGFIPGGNVGPGKRGLNLGESELTLAASIDPRFAGQMTFSLSPDNTVSVEEAFFQTRDLSNGLNLKAGRFLSAVGYLNGQHAHTWDFVDAPLAYQAFFGGQYKPDGVQLRWLAPTDQFLELGLEAGRGSTFPGNDRNRNGIGSTALFAHLGDDIGESASYRAGLSYLRTSAAQRRYDDIDSVGNDVVNAFTGNSSTIIADGVYKWSPNGNPVQTNLKLQGEYFRRTDRGSLSSDAPAQSTGYRAAQSGWYLQGIYQFTAGWRAGLRYDRLHSGTPEFGGGTASAASFSQLASYQPRRATVMLDYSPSEFSRFRLQFAQDRARPDATDNQIFLQYIMSLGAHGAHTF